MKRVEVGGQAVIEGVMMRSPRSFAVVCRRPSGEIVVREAPWEPVWGGLRFLRWPFFRGAIVLIESLWNGFSALSFAARQQTVPADAPLPPRSLGARAHSGEMSEGATWFMMAVSIAFGLALFVGVPHLLTWALGFDSRSFAFHLVDGVIKVCLLVGYMAAISLLPDIKRVFQYHGAEHKAIATYEAGLPLTVDNARAQSRFHPRCGTSFLLIVVGVSVVLFAVLLRGEISDVPVVDNVVKILLKLPLMLPVAALGYELLKISGKLYDRSALARAVAAPGLALQHITTREPTDDQLEIALLSIRKTLWRERQAQPIAGDDLCVYRTAAEVDF
ncbi:MAG TPA: DUF1385 domain-containing protein [Haliangiales bacterium]|nr:DUF1385 domain-containing protein [Haliangiales bacterium]